jgi:Homoserine dehydrogenase, NAD binding domain
VNTVGTPGSRKHHVVVGGGFGGLPAVSKLRLLRLRSLGTSTVGLAVPMKDVRVWIVGLGTVGQWLLRALHEYAARLEGRYGFVPTVVGVANARHGFVHDADGLDPRILLEHVSSARPLGELPGVRHWRSAVEGLGATDADVLVEVTASPAESGEPGVTHMREVLRRGIPVVTSNKWPVARHGVQLAELARERLDGAASQIQLEAHGGAPRWRSSGLGRGPARRRASRARRRRGAT